MMLLFLAVFLLVMILKSASRNFQVVAVGAAGLACLGYGLLVYEVHLYGWYVFNAVT